MKKFLFISSFLLMLSLIVSCGYENESNPINYITDLPIITIKSIVPGSQTITINWTDPAVADFEYIIVSWTPGGKSHKVTKGEETFTVTGLDDNIDYTFSLVAYGSNGNMSQPVTITARPVDFTAPGLLEITSITATINSITVTWTEPADLDFDHVAITWTPGGLTEQTVAKGIYTFTAEGLNSAAEYTFRLYAVDILGNKSEFVMAKSKLAEITPPGPVVLKSYAVMDATINIEWTNPVDTDFDHIDITYDPGNINSQLPGNPGSTASYENNVFVNDTDYTFTLVAVDDVGNKSEPVTVTIKPENIASYRYHFYIYTAEDLNAVRGGVTGYDYWGLDENYTIMEDIDLSGFPSWSPIGIMNGSFTGTFNGNGHTITNLVANNPAVDYQGLFSQLSDTAFVRDLNIEQCNIAGNSQVGCLAGKNGGGTIFNCHISGILKGEQSVGGIVGAVDSNGKISNCSADVNVTVNMLVAGGLVGSIDDSEITNCYAIGDIIGGMVIGGLFGSATAGVNITNCYASANVSGSQNLGGLSGMCAGTITSCYYDIEATPSNNGIGTLVTTADMKIQGTFTGWDFIGTWAIDPGVNNGYPYLISNP